MKSVSYDIHTRYGKFRLKFTVSFDRNTNIPQVFIINIGSATKQCVQLKIPTRHTVPFQLQAHGLAFGKDRHCRCSPIATHPEGVGLQLVESGTRNTDAYLLWVEADENCSLEHYIQKGLARHMTLLGITLAREINPMLKTISFEDTSSFPCALPNETTQRVPMKAFHIAFHGATWYEYYFGAKLQRNHAEYEELKKNLHNPNSKPAQYDFINSELQDALDPLYASSTTWYEFFQKISDIYDKKKCGIVYPWLTYAMSDIFKGNIYDNPKWYIDLNENMDKVPRIIYSMTDISKRGGGRKMTLKKRKGRRFTYSRTHIFPHVRIIQGWNYLKFLSRSDDN
jgi:hypothetical protein